MTDANSWREPLRSLDSTKAQGLTAAWQVSTKMLRVLGNFILSSSVRHSVEASSTSRSSLTQEALAKQIGAKHRKYQKLGSRPGSTCKAVLARRPVHPRDNLRSQLGSPIR